MRRNESFAIRSLLAVTLCAIMACRSSGPFHALAHDHEQSGSAPWKDPQCGFVRVNQFSEAQSLVSEFVRRAANGQFVSRWEDAEGHPGRAWAAWFDSALACPSRQPRPAAPFVLPSVVIASYSIGTVRAVRDGVTVPIAYEELGSLAAGVFQSARSHRQVEISVVRTPWGWRIDHPELVQRISVSGALSAIHLSSATQRALEQALRNAGTG